MGFHARNCFAFLLYQVKAENPTVSITELSKIIGAKWREMTAEEKEPYEEKARQDKQRYVTTCY